MTARSLVRVGGEPPPRSVLAQQPGGGRTARGLGWPPYPRTAGSGAAAPAEGSPPRDTPQLAPPAGAGSFALCCPPQPLPCPLTPRPGRRLLSRSPPPVRSRPGAADAVNMADGRVPATSRGRERRAGAGGGLSSAAAPAQGGPSPHPAADTLPAGQARPCPAALAGERSRGARPGVSHPTPLTVASPP